MVEGRGLPEGNAASKTRPGHRAGQGAPSALGRVRRIAQRDKDARFTALLHHVDVDRLRAAYFALRPKAAPGVDGLTWHEYGQELEDSLRDLHARVHCGSYRCADAGWHEPYESRGSRADLWEPVGAIPAGYPSEF